MELSNNDLREFLRPKRVSVAERFHRLNLDKRPEDLLTGDKEPTPTLPPPLIPSPYEPLTKSQILSLYDKPFTFVSD